MCVCAVSVLCTCAVCVVCGCLHKCVGVCISVCVRCVCALHVCVITMLTCREEVDVAEMHTPQLPAPTLYVFVHARTHTNTRTHAHTGHTHTYAHTHSHTHTHTRTHTRTHKHAHTRTHAHTQELLVTCAPDLASLLFALVGDVSARGLQLLLPPFGLTLLVGQGGPPLEMLAPALHKLFALMGCL